MTIKTRSELESAITTALPDNTSGEISPADIRQNLLDAVASATFPEDIDGLQSDLDAKAPLASPALTGIPTAPTAADGTNNTQIATTAFVQALINALINGAPGAMDQINELAAAMNNDPNFYQTIINALAGKMATDFSNATGTVPDAQLPLSLRNSVALPTGNDWDNAKRTGWYSGYDLAHAPEPTRRFIGMVETYIADQYATITVSQLSAGQNATNTPVYRRHLLAGVWGDWYRLRISEAEQASLWATVAQGAKADAAMPKTGGTFTGSVDVYGYDWRTISVHTVSDTASPSNSLFRARGGAGAPTSVLANDVLGAFTFWGWDGSAYKQSAFIQALSQNDFATEISTMFRFSVFNAGTFTIAQTIYKTGGVVFGNAAGGDPGLGKINAVDYEINGESITTKLTSKLDVDAQAADSAKLNGKTDTDFAGVADIADMVSSTDATNIVKCTQAQYDALTPDASTLYLIVG